MTRNGEINRAALMRRVWKLDVGDAGACGRELCSGWAFFGSNRHTGVRWGGGGGITPSKTYHNVFLSKFLGKQFWNNFLSKILTTAWFFSARTYAYGSKFGKRTLQKRKIHFVLHLLFTILLPEKDFHFDTSRWLQSPFQHHDLSIIIT